MHGAVVAVRADIFQCLWGGHLRCLPPCCLRLLTAVTYGATRPPNAGPGGNGDARRCLGWPLRGGIRFGRRRQLSALTTPRPDDAALSRVVPSTVPLVWPMAPGANGRRARGCLRPGASKVDVWLR